ncbi:MAG: hypothetical protein SP1CHLAM54_15510 [Chlamydiia bacterium]|nr:hypothetical protein [Chlamydiia bacterium]MCH9616441.1 hypothetical protein [Chlamydiia bacterium]MCH9629573.1 hypothetical protein [Chlamydiia bacterium]
MFSQEELRTLNQRGLIAGPKELDSAFQARVSLTKPGIAVDLSLYGAKPDHLQVTEKKVPFWQAGYAEGEKITVRKSTKEVLEHEAVHVMRAQFEEPRFEEYFAYQTSPWWHRRFFGPLFKSNTEIILLLIASILSFISPLIPVSLFSLFILRRLFDGLTIRRAKKRFSKAYPKVDPLHLLVRLTDKEIAKCTLPEPGTIRYKQLISLTTP